MEITQVKIFPVQEDKLKAFVSVVFDHCFMVNDIKVIQGKDGLFLSMPSRRKKSGEFKDVAHPLNNETRRMLEERVLSEYRREVDDVTPRRPDREAHEFDAYDERPSRGRGTYERRPEGRRPSPRAPQERAVQEQAARDRDVSPQEREDRNREDQGREDQGREDQGREMGSVTSLESRRSRRRPSDGQKRSGVAAVASASGPDKTLEEVQEMHLSDSFWSVS